MTLAGWIVYNIFACSVLALVGYLTARAGNRRQVALTAEFEARAAERTARSAEEDRAAKAEWARHKAETAAFLAELDAEEEDDIELAVQLRKHPETDAEKLPGLAALLIRSIDQLDLDLGGDGVEFDAEATTEDATHLTLHLTFRDPDGAEERRAEILRTLADLADTARQRLVSAQDADLRAKIAAELNSPIPRDVAARLDPLPA